MINSIYNKFRRITSSHLYFPEIDGIRFIAIMLVILFHAHGYFAGKTTLQFADNPASYTWINNFLENGDRGVELFFVLSGFILCLPFAQQYISNGKKIALKKYYLRRVTRLEPPYIIAMTLILLLQIIMHVHPTGALIPSWLASLIYSHNLIYHHTPLLTVVAWSLEIEIQFYLLAPILFRVLKLAPIVRRALLLTGMLLLIYAQSVYTPPFRNIYSYAQYFLTGILLADFYVCNTAAAIFNQKWMIPVSAALLVTICTWTIKNAAANSMEAMAFHFSFPFMIGLFYYTVFKNDVIKSVFSYKFIPIAGGMCYSIYLLHYTIISIFGRATLRLHLSNYYLPNLLLQIVLLLIPVMVLSSIFYYYVERPFMSSKWTDMLMKKKKA
jgi:peptidoglycan/LPS O-acetylase OafA/YrhL